MHPQQRPLAAFKSRELVGIYDEEVDVDTFELAEGTHILPSTISPRALAADRKRLLLSVLCGIGMRDGFALLLYLIK